MADNTTKLPYRNTPLSFVSSVLDMAKEDEVDNILVAGRMKNGEVFTGYCQMTHAEMMTLIGYLQARAMDRRHEEEFE